MSFSVNTNAGALAALQNLNKTSTSLDVTQTRINTGLKVSSVKDNAAVYSIAQTLRGNVAGLNAVNNSLDRARSVVDVALAAAEATSDLLIEMRELAVAGSDAGLDADSRTAMSEKYTQLRDQIESIVNNATFNGRNVADGTNAISAITDDNGTSTISIAASDLTLSTLSLEDSNLITYGAALPSGTPVSLAGTTIAASSDSEFRAALVNAQTDNGGNFGGETIDGSTGVTTNNVGGTPTVEFEEGLKTYLGLTGADYSSGRVDGYAYDVTFSGSTSLYLVRDGASSYLTLGNPAGGGSADSSAASEQAVTAIDAAIDSVNTTLSTLGATANRLDIQKQFAGQLSDGIEVGIGNLVDADLAKESATLQAIQTKQQLGLQALSIANQAPSTVLSLFR
ncbi:flagellin [Kordiimonas pumila]|uniref:Flagellin n=1 Tax=Kordiimonas pumila TaxID=2161677 RepID=A0ABV7CZV2_9PROT|nr:flagellin [Kordiimonas pumila]